MEGQRAVKLYSTRIQGKRRVLQPALLLLLGLSSTAAFHQTISPPRTAASKYINFFGRRSPIAEAGRDGMEIKGLPRSSIMRTNFTTAIYEDGDAEMSFPEMELTSDWAKVVGGIGSVLSSAALISGCMTGAGIIALPSVTVNSGFLPSTAAILGVWSYCLITSLLIAEVCINAKDDMNIEHASYLKIAGSTIGKNGGTVAFGFFTIFQFLLLIAYMSQGGNLLLSIADSLGATGLTSMLQDSAGPALFATVMGALLIGGTPKVLTNVNNGCVAVVVMTFLSLVSLGLPSIEPTLLQHFDVGHLHQVVPVATCALVFQNLIPVISSQLKFDRNKILAAIVLGSVMPCGMHLLWNAVVLGNMPPGTTYDVASMFSSAGLAFRVFSLSAIVTSFIGCFLSVIEEFNEFTRSVRTNPVEQHTHIKKGLLYSSVLIPPAILATFFPGLFLTAIENSGGYSDPLLFGLLPVAMAWKQRYPKSGSPSTSQPIVPGGKSVLMGVVAVTVGMIINKSSDQLGELGSHLLALADTQLM